MPFKLDHLNRISAHSGPLDKFDKFVKQASEEREIRYEEWKAWKPKPCFQPVYDFGPS